MSLHFLDNEREPRANCSATTWCDRDDCAVCCWHRALYAAYRESRLEPPERNNEAAIAVINRAIDARAMAAWDCGWNAYAGIVTGLRASSPEAVYSALREEKRRDITALREAKSP